MRTVYVKVRRRGHDTGHGRVQGDRERARVDP